VENLSRAANAQAMLLVLNSRAGREKSKKFEVKIKKST
jgi:hypothetical protein